MTTNKLTGNITENFTWERCLHSDTALKNGIDNTPTDKDVIDNIIKSIEIQQIVRNEIGKPIFITSGYRSPDLCEKIGSKRYSRHAKGLAIDSECLAMTTAKFALTIAETVIKYDLKVAKIILEHYTGGNSGWVHTARFRGGEKEYPLKLFTASKHKGKTIYPPINIEDLRQIVEKEEEKYTK